MNAFFKLLTPALILSITQEDGGPPQPPEEDAIGELWGKSFDVVDKERTLQFLKVLQQDVEDILSENEKEIAALRKEAATRTMVGRLVPLFQANQLESFNRENRITIARFISLRNAVSQADDTGGQIPRLKLTDEQIQTVKEAAALNSGRTWFQIDGVPANP